MAISFASCSNPNEGHKHCIDGKNEDELSIRRKFECGDYSMNDIPNILFFDLDDVWIRRDAPHPGEVQCRYLCGSMTKAHSFKKNSGRLHGCISAIHVKYFESRDKFDELVQRSGRAQGARENTIGKIPLRDVLDKIHIDLSINMKYYSEHQDQLEKDLGHECDMDLEFQDEARRKRLEEELFYKLMCKLFGEDGTGTNMDDSSEPGHYEKTLNLEGFSYVDEGCDYLAASGTTRRGDYYYYFDVCD